MVVRYSIQDGGARTGKQIQSARSAPDWSSLRAASMWLRSRGLLGGGRGGYGGDGGGITGLGGGEGDGAKTVALIVRLAKLGSSATIMVARAVELPNACVSAALSNVREAFDPE
jgi:hypothetical protein